ncbi:hypothetical protein ISF26_23840 (plasmid) [Gloeobacter morelensis MG652769]|nr:hypothetical protein ISF26_23840 [Gloeobacter morelensis MG652769]
MQEGGSGGKEATLEGYWSPSEISQSLGIHRQTVVDAINGIGRYPGALPAIRFGQLLYVPDAHARAFMDWFATGEVVELDSSEEEEKVYWTTDEIARAIGKHRSTVIKAITGRGGKYDSKLPATKVQGKTWLVKDADAREFIEKHITRGT